MQFIIHAHATLCFRRGPHPTSTSLHSGTNAPQSSATASFLPHHATSCCLHGNNAVADDCCGSSHLVPKILQSIRCSVCNLIHSPLLSSKHSLYFVVLKYSLAMGHIKGLKSDFPETCSISISMVDCMDSAGLQNIGFTPTLTCLIA